MGRGRITRHENGRERAYSAISWLSESEADHSNGVHEPDCKCGWDTNLFSSHNAVLPRRFEAESTRTKVVKFPCVLRSPAKEDLMNVMHGRCAGLDVHKESISACVLIASKVRGKACKSRDRRLELSQEIYNS